MKRVAIVLLLLVGCGGREVEPAGNCRAELEHCLNNQDFSGLCYLHFVRCERRERRSSGG